MTPPADPLRVDVAIVGAGFSGLGVAIGLRREGLDDFVVLERHAAVGGTWWENTYPGCACDVPSHLYSFSFAPNPRWSETYSAQPEILSYLERCAGEHDLHRHIRLDTAVKEARWDEEARRWALDTTSGRVVARVLVGATGPFSLPRVPRLRGLEDFRGTAFHSARWEPGHDVAGRHVAVIGTGASAIQIVPAIAPRAARVHVFQRTPPWVLPHRSRPISHLERRVYRRLPPAQKAVRGLTYASREFLAPAFVKDPRLMRPIEALARRHIRRQIADPALRARVTPGYTIGCKRILPSNGWYPALMRPNVDLVTSGIREVRASSIVDGEGITRPVDTIVFATGFHVADAPVGHRIRGRGGRTLADAWRGSPRAHVGAMVAGFPNLFLMLGPNTGLGHSSMVYVIESQIAHVLDALRVMERHGAEVAEVRADSQDAYNAEIDARMTRTVWSTGCASWYIDANGRNATLWPDWTWRFRMRARRFDPAEHVFGAAAGASAAGAAGPLSDPG